VHNESCNDSYQLKQSLTNCSILVAETRTVSYWIISDIYINIVLLDIHGDSVLFADIIGELLRSCLLFWRGFYFQESYFGEAEFILKAAKATILLTLFGERSNIRSFFTWRAIGSVCPS